MKKTAKRLRKGRAYLGREKRQHPRFTIDASVSYKVKKFPPPEKMIRLLDSMRESRAVDVSRGGMSFLSRQLIVPGSTVEVQIPRSAFGPARRRKARVVWINEVAEDKYRVGVKFLK